jgi:shikimate kinase
MQPSPTSQNNAQPMSLPMQKTKKSILALPIVLVGMMGSGKSSVGRKLATRLSLPFTDSDQEIEHAAGCSISEFFSRYGEEEFRAGERRVIARLLEKPMQIISVGGGAFIQDATRAVIHERAVAIWLKVDPKILAERVGRRQDRPLLQGYADPETAVTTILSTREPVYSEAHITVPSGSQPIEETVERVVHALADYATANPRGTTKQLVIS